MPDEVRQGYEDAILRPHGMILVTGPTGSGKTTTLYTALARINAPDLNIVTIEDPVEIRLPMVRQVQVNAEIGLTFASALRAILRQDPDVVLVGEVRDDETAKIAVQAALTGHLVFSTLHTNDAVSSVTRLRDFGVPGFAIGNALLAAIAQRLVRRVCAPCAVMDQPEPADLRALGINPLQSAMLRRGAGCPACRSTGFHGRVGIFEMFRVTPGAQALLEASAPASALAEQARRDGMRSMIEDGVSKVLRGVTTAREVASLASHEHRGELRASA
jgi:type II secretory ATPase GspE/PulE/Tfp pilus assembly ATPase PilB-like protein